MAEQMHRTAWESLPELELPPSLWPRLDAARRRQRRTRWLAPALAAGVAALGIGLAALVVQPPTPVDPMAALIEDNQRLLDALQQRQAAAGELAVWQARRIRALELELALLDRKLQAGYVGSNIDVDMASLWRTRAALLGSMIEAYEQPRHILSI